MASHPKMALYEEETKTSSRRGGLQWRRPKHQFWAIYEKTGSFNAATHALGYRGQDGRADTWDDDGLCHWPNDNRPSISIMRDWADQYDNGDAEIDPKIKQAILRRYENNYDFQIKEAVKDTVMTGRDSFVVYAKKAQKGELKAEDSPFVQHFANSVQNTVRAISNQLHASATESKKAGKTRLRQAKRPANVSNIDRTA